MRNKKLYLIIIISLCLGIVVLFLPHNNTDTKEIREAVDSFYVQFSRPLNQWNDFMTQQGNKVGAQHLVNYRFYYGDIHDYIIKKISSIDNDHKAVTVEVTATLPSAGQTKLEDHLTFVFEDNLWKLQSYTSTSQDYWPKLP